MNAETREEQVAALPRPRQLVFAAAACEHLCQTLRTRLAEWRFDEVTEPRYRRWLFPG